MNFYAIALGVFTASLSLGALAEGGGDRTFALMMERNEKAMADYAVKNGKPAPEVQAYRYGMKLDIAKVINVTPPIRACNPVPSRMTYEDSRGNLNTLEYQVMGVCRNNGS
ncbi:DUF2790 domain-containing protein [Pseudomonas sp. 13B_2.1_Bac1]|jgi:hypothetical protein|uniref:DUF2790 domain-containing protein n=1 Tax=Pseudomonas aylmerensis TaxID=1869229 RepID=A0A2T4G308_9PSED|nr:MULTISPECIES: DUF2790 domain-containing protein [Pseudomonas]AYF46693.1 DUF2790 domain-containing protein [Pseudomonas fluorescens]MBK5475046.1 DUF2790 domain-containing protein [Pseudomonas sp. TH21]MBS7846861.1 DUF2790 domain-containing protein [Pseudomonas fluorescens]MCU1787153.1 DUF2790 domain-containing protein [Pseudomonas sp. 13B_2.1_Bac1]OCW29550.1 hypothetical protein BBG20_03905 [Pseudomonas aylmerensis]